MDWFSIKIAFIDWIGIERDLAHIYAGLLVQFAVAASLRRSVASIIPLMVLLGLELVNEWFDIGNVGGLDAMTPQFWFEAWYDLFNTMAAPLLLCCASRFTPWLLVDRHRLAQPLPAQQRW
jgi:hypothetical protein